jgi:calcium-binding protein CML
MMVDGIQGCSNLNVQMMSNMQEKMFAKLDPDGDGQIDLTELKAQAQATGESDDRFTRMLEDLTAADTDGDGVVTQEEFNQMPPPPPPPSEDMEDQLFSLLDSDGDGQIDLTELQSQANEIEGTDSRFSELLKQLTAADANGDSLITKDEFSTMELYTKDSNMSVSNNMVGELFDQLS